MAVSVVSNLAAKPSGTAMSPPATGVLTASDLRFAAFLKSFEHSADTRHEPIEPRRQQPVAHKAAAVSADSGEKPARGNGNSVPTASSAQVESEPTREIARPVPATASRPSNTPASQNPGSARVALSRASGGVAERPEETGDSSEAIIGRTNGQVDKTASQETVPEREHGKVNAPLPVLSDNANDQTLPDQNNITAPASLAASQENAEQQGENGVAGDGGSISASASTAARNLPAPTRPDTMAGDIVEMENEGSQADDETQPAARSMEEQDTPEVREDGALRVMTQGEGDRVQTLVRHALGDGTFLSLHVSGGNKGGLHVDVASNDVSLVEHMGKQADILSSLPQNVSGLTAAATTQQIAAVPMALTLAVRTAVGGAFSQHDKATSTRERMDEQENEDQLLGVGLLNLHL